MSIMLMHSRVRIMITKINLSARKRCHIAAVKLQYCWLCHKARITAFGLKCIKSTLKIQSVVRGRFGRKRFGYFLNRRNNWEKMRAAALARITPVVIGRLTRRRYGPALRRFKLRRQKAASRIQVNLAAVKLGNEARRRVKRIRQENSAEALKDKGRD